MAEHKVLLTSAIDCYYGVFKAMNDSQLREIFMKAREKGSIGKIGDMSDLLHRAVELADGNDVDKETLQDVIFEMERYEKYIIPPGTEAVFSIDWRDIGNRSLERHDEKRWGFPQSIFYLNIGFPGSDNFRRLVGRKLLSERWLEGRIPEVHCCHVTAAMILGLASDFRVTENKVIFFYHPLKNEEKVKIFNDIVAADGKESEIYFPFPLMPKSTMEEKCSPSDGWMIDDAYAEMLTNGEEKIREFTKVFLREQNFTNHRLYDPACSTGYFLSQMKEALPGSYTIGQDLSESMAEYAKGKVDEIYCGNALLPKIPEGSADVVFNRFLNSEVVKSKEAEELLEALLPTVKDGGIMITFGLTTVLLSSAFFKRIPGFEVMKCVAVAVDKSAIFQYYVIQRDRKES